MASVTQQGSRFEAAARGEAWAVRELVELCDRFARHVCGRASSAWRAGIEADDLAQDAAARLLTVGIAQYGGRGSEESFVYTLVRSTFLMRIRAADRRRQREETVAVATPEAVDDAHAGLEVRSLLARLDATCRDLLRRVFLEEEPYASVAAELELAESSVRAKVSRCVGRARELV